jgi:methionyl-tRNA formyltransferase
VLARDGAPLMVETLAGLEDGTIVPRQQDHARATLAPILTRDDGRVDPRRYTAKELWNRWRGFQPWPGAFAFLNGRKLTFTRLLAGPGPYPNSLAMGEPGELHFATHWLFLACAQGTWLEVCEVQPEGKRSMRAAEFWRGARLNSGVRLE